MKKLVLLAIVATVLTIFNGCQNDELISQMADERLPLVEKSLSLEKEMLKKRLNETAKIVASILSDKSTLNEITYLISKQPREMEDRLLFADLFKENVTVKTDAGSFANKFKSKLIEMKHPDILTLINYLIDQGIEIYVPYPIADYPIGTDIVVTSNPIDNIYENDGYFVSNPKKMVRVNENLRKTNPIIIINTPMFSAEVQAKLVESRLYMEKSYENFKKLQTKNNFSIPLKSGQALSTIDWNTESNHYGIVINKFFCTNDYISGLFASAGTLVFTSGTVNFDANTRAVLGGIEKGTVTCYFPRKYEDYARKGWNHGWVPLNFFMWQDWHPAITSNSITVYIDHPSTSSATTFGLSALFKYVLDVSTGSMILKPEGSLTASVSNVYTVQNMDHLYFSTTWLRERYIYDYYSANPPLRVVWGEDGETSVNIDGVDRPALAFCNDLYITTSCYIW